jgi:hypothetical protein
MAVHVSGIFPFEGWSSHLRVRPQVAGRVLGQSLNTSALLMIFSETILSNF